MKPRRREESSTFAAKLQSIYPNIRHNLLTGKCPSDLVIRAETPAKNFIEYEHGRASFYENHLVKHFRPVHYMDLKKISWWQEWVY